jgi:hemoglobin
MLPEREIYTPELGPPGLQPGLDQIFQEWGEEALRDLVSRFYDRIPHSQIAAMFPDDLQLAKQKQADFLIQVTGGPSYYLNNWGPARMRMRHFPFEINESARLEWLRCYMESLEESNFTPKSKEIFALFLDQFSKWMVNKR